MLNICAWRAKEMKITRKQLRKLINEAMIKPGIPNIPSAEAMGKIDMMARSEDLQADADSMAGAFGYPEDRSYSADLRGYDAAGRLGKEIENMSRLGNDYADSFSHDDPYVMGAGEGYYLRRHALEGATKICNSFDISLVRPLIDAFTEGANDYQRAQAARTGREPRLYKPVDMANQISATFGNKSPISYMSLYDND